MWNPFRKPERASQPNESIRELKEAVKKRDGRQPDDFSEVNVLARTLYGEARGESWGGMEAVALVILNRALDRTRWPNRVREVCLQPKQFSCWNVGDPNREIILRSASVLGKDERYQLCLLMAQLALNGELHDFTRGANHYHARGTKPYWADRHKVALTLGNHVFYKL